MLLIYHILTEFQIQIQTRSLSPISLQIPAAKAASVAVKIFPPKHWDFSFSWHPTENGPILFNNLNLVSVSIQILEIRKMETWKHWNIIFFCSISLMSGYEIIQTY